jgi:hypothetical protein
MGRQSPEQMKVGQSATAAFETGVDAWQGNWLTIPNEERN